MKKVLLILVALYALCSIKLEADTLNSGPDILRILNSSSMISMGGIGLSPVNSINGLFVNPSYIVNADSLVVSTMHLMWLEDYSLEFLSGIYPSPVGHFGLGLIYLHQPEDLYLDETGTQTGLVLNKNDVGVLLTYENPMLGFPLGITGKYIRHKLVKYSGSSLLFDIGLKYGYSMGRGSLLIGLGVKNVGSGPKFITEEMKIPFYVPLELGYTFQYNIVGVGIYAGLNIYSNKELKSGIGTELMFMKRYGIRAGYRYGYDKFGLSLGAGVRHPFKNIELNFDYGIILGEGLGATHSFQLTANFKSMGKKGLSEKSYNKLDLSSVKEVLESDPYARMYDEVTEFINSSIEVRIESAEGSTAIQYPENACDKNEGTRWESEQKNDPQWIIFVIDKIETIRGMKIRWEAAAAKRYDVLVSLDKKNWETIESVYNGEMGQERVIKFRNPVKAKYVKILGQERCGQDWGYSIWEVRIYK